MALSISNFEPEIILPIGRGGYYPGTLVDEICSVGETISIVKEKVAELGVSSVKSAVLYAHSWGSDVPDYIGLITDELVLNPWDREILRDGMFRFHPEYVDALEQQGLKVEPQLIIPVTEIRLAKG